MSQLVACISELDPSCRWRLLIWHLIVFILYIGLRWSYGQMRDAVRPQVVIQKTKRTPLGVVWFSVVGCATFLVLLVIIVGLIRSC